jgi:hypothetical protein
MRKLTPRTTLFFGKLLISTRIRSKKQHSLGDGTVVNGQSVQGTAMANEAAVRIRWGWIILLLLQFILGTGFVIATAILTHQAKVEVLKNSALALLFALGEECRNVAGGLETIPGMTRKARVLQVRRRGEYIEMVGAATPPRARTPGSRGSPIEKRVTTVVEEEEKMTDKI